MADAEVWFGLLGPMEITVGGTTVAVPAQIRVLLAALLCRPNRVVSADELGDILWGDRHSAASAATLRGHVLRLRRVLGTAANRVQTVAPGYRIDVDPQTELDTAFFDRHRAAAGDAARVGDWPAVSEAAAAALLLWRGAPLADVPSERLQQDHVPGWTRARNEVAELAARADLELGRAPEAATALERLAVEQPLQESVHALLMAALAAAGQRAEALAVYRRLRAALSEELGLEPGPQITAVHQRILSPGPGSHGKRGTRQESSADPALGGSGSDPVSDSTSILRQLPADLVTFTGRIRELRALVDQAASVFSEADGPAAVPVAVIEGMAGVGKTQLAVHAAHHLVRAGHFTDVQLYINLRGFDPERPPADPAAVLDTFLRQLGVPGQQIPETLDERAAMFRDRIHGRNALIVLDNAANARQVRDLLPATPRVLVLITSRRSLVDLEGAASYVLDVFHPDEARALLAKVAGEARMRTEPEAAEQIVRASGGLPLAVSIAAARLKSRPTWPLRELASRLAAGPGAIVSAERSLESVFDLSYRGLGTQTSQLFRLLGQHPGSDFTASSAAALAGLEPARAEVLLERLHDEKLLHQKSADRYEMHDLLRRYARERGLGDDPGQRAAARSRLLGHYLHNAHHAAMTQVPTRDPIPVPLESPPVALEPIPDAAAAADWFEAEFGALRELIGETAESEPVVAWQLAWSLVGHCMKTARFWELVSAQTVALRAAQHLADPAAVAYALHTRALAKSAVHDQKGAVADCAEAVEISRSIGDHYHEARGLSGIAAAKSQMEDHPACLEYAKRALRVSRTLGADGRPEQARSLNLIGWSHAQLGELDEAVAACEESIRLAGELDDLWTQAAALDSLAFAHREGGAYDKSVATYRRALAIHDRYGAAVFRARTLIHLGDVLDLTRDRESALAVFEEALRIFETADEQRAERTRQRIAELSARSLTREAEWEPETPTADARGRRA